jgi:hypothetical protein
MSDPTRRTIIAAATLGASAAAAQELGREPIKGNEGATMLGPHNSEREA